MRDDFARAIAHDPGTDWQRPPHRRSVIDVRPILLYRRTKQARLRAVRRWLPRVLLALAAFLALYAVGPDAWWR